MSPDQIRGLVSQTYGELEARKIGSQMLIEIAAQLAEINESLKMIAHPQSRQEEEDPSDLSPTE